MAGVQGQADVVHATITVANLTQSLVKICTSDGVAEETIRFLDALGARYPVSPLLAGEIRSICMNGRETLLSNLKIAVGWRKDDTAALLAQSSGGLSFLAFFAAAREVFDVKQMVSAINIMSESELPNGVIPSGGRDLETCLRALEPRITAFGFSTHFAKVLTAIRRSFFATGVAAMDVISDEVSSLSVAVGGRQAVGVIRALLTPEKLEDRYLVFKGISGMGWVAAAAIWWRGEDSVTLISNGEHLLRSENPSVVINIDAYNRDRTILYWYEGRLQNMAEILPVEDERARCFVPRVQQMSLRFPIQGFVTTVLHHRGFPLDFQKSIAGLVADFIWDLVHHIAVDNRHCCSPPKPLMKFLGHDAALIISKSLDTTCGVRPTRPPDNPGTAMAALHERVWQALHTSYTPSSPAEACPGDCQTKGMCPTVGRELSVIKQTFAAIIVLFFVDADPGLSMTLADHNESSEFDSLLDIHAPPGDSFDYYSLGTAGGCPILELNTMLIKLTAYVGTTGNFFTTYGPLYQRVLVDRYIGSSSNGVCSYLAAAADPSISRDVLARIRVAQGGFIYRDQYYDHVVAEDPAFMLSEVGSPQDSLELNLSTRSIDPSCGILKSTEITVRDDSDSLYIRIKVSDYYNNSRYINLSRAVWSAALAVEVECAHSPETALDAQPGSLVDSVLLSDVVIPVLSVARPEISFPPPVVVIAAQGSSPSALFSSDVCGTYDRPILICRNACLSCGLVAIIREQPVSAKGPTFTADFESGVTVVLS
ncbi:hypothetical protein GP486_004977 [Trichoglossum hirsutum]|uniref:Uncharacterized protein n=1 Tax=Trichoglossum hirsutum TaxID=265104 RepID=A0A9P8LAC5_9PEZI|nr:hypothetical protein GP486_004977 [Trichoglossum hirsutum]